MKQQIPWRAWGFVTLAIAVTVAAVWVIQSVKKAEVSVTVDDRINVTPEQIESIKAIGEWEFLAVADEELVDTVRKGLFSDDYLSRIYYGTMRLGVNMHQVEPGWLKAYGDSIDVTLPPIILLDNDFIDEARTRNFHEKGTWKAEDREAMFRRAHQKMLRHGWTRQNVTAARENGEVMFRKMMQAMGFEHVNIQWSDRRQPAKSQASQTKH